MTGRIAPVRILRVHFRLCISILIGIFAALISPQFGITSGVTQSIVGYDVGAIIYICWATFIISRSDQQDIRSRALKHDDGKILVLILAVVAILFSTCAIFVDLGSVKHLAGAEKYGYLFLALTTIVASWFLTAIIFALHYAHDYYFEIQHDRDGGLVFLPADEDPTYWDFIYFAFILSATAQTADVTLSSKQMRRTCTLHSVLSFFFNTTILALTVSLASNLI